MRVPPILGSDEHKLRAQAKNFGALLPSFINIYAPGTRMTTFSHVVATPCLVCASQLMGCGDASVHRLMP